MFSVIQPKFGKMIYIMKWPLLILFITIVVINLKQTNLPYVDDAYIFLRYANNIVHGYGFVWNPGTAPIEGYTSFLYLILIVIIQGFLHVGGASISGWLGITFSIFSLLLTWKMIETIIPDKPLVCLTVVAVVGFSPHFLYWTTAGLDVTLFSSLILGSTIVYFRSIEGKIPLWVVGLFFSLVALSRPEGIILIFIPLLFEIVRNYPQGRRNMYRNIFLLILPFIAIYVPYFLWRWSYFGFLFPNTFYAKTGAGLIQLEGGILYWWKSIVQAYGMSSLVICTNFLIFIPIIRFKKCNIKIAYLFLTMLLIWVVAIGVGGDHFGDGRFIIPSIPYFMALGATGFMVLYEKHKIALLSGVLALILIITNSVRTDEFKAFRKNFGNIVYSRIQQLPIANSSRYEIYDGYVTGFSIMGKTIKEIASTGQSIAVVPIGAIGYYSNIKVIDMLGVVDPVIAHEPFDPSYIASWRPGHDKGDGKYILSLHPDYIQLIDYLTSKPIAEPDDNMMQYKSVVEIWNSPEFQEEYEFYPLEVGNGWYYNLYRRNP
jgi:arabinofuranosyltransferase